MAASSIIGVPSSEMKGATRIKPAIPAQQVPDLRKVVAKGDRSAASWNRVDAARARMSLPVARPSR